MLCLNLGENPRKYDIYQQISFQLKECLDQQFFSSLQFISIFNKLQLYP